MRGDGRPPARLGPSLANPGALRAVAPGLSRSRPQGVPRFRLPLSRPGALVCSIICACFRDCRRQGGPVRNWLLITVWFVGALVPLRAQQRPLQTDEPDPIAVG